MELSEGKDTEGSFSRDMRHRMLEDFVVAYYNGTIKPNLAEKDPVTGRDVEFLMDGPQFARTKKSEIWSYSGATGTGYEYRVTYRDRRFSSLEQLLGMYSGSEHADEGDRPLVEQRLYELLLLLMKEGRLPQSFKVQPSRDARVDRLDSEVQRLSHALDGLEKRVKSLEALLQGEPQSEGPTNPGTPIPNP